jgi:glycosyltransferase involved in cell wall biosynthesis
VPPSLSIITPSLNQGAFIERTIRSVLDQGYEPLEYLIVDGGSSDDSVEVIERHQDRLAWWVSEPDRGQTDALNKALGHATGDVIAYINSDDYYLPGAFARAIEALEASGRPWVCGAARFVDEDGATTEVWRPQPPETTEMFPRGRHWWMLSPWGLPQPSAFWRREVFDQVGSFREDMNYAFDTEFFLRLAYAGIRPELIADELSVRVVHAEAKSGADLTPFRAEAARFVEVFRPQLSRGERLKLAVSRALLAGARVTTVPLRRLIGRLRAAGGDA